MTMCSRSAVLSTVVPRSFFHIRARSDLHKLLPLRLGKLENHLKDGTKSYGEWGKTSNRRSSTRSLLYPPRSVTGTDSFKRKTDGTIAQRAFGV